MKPQGEQRTALQTDSAPKSAAVSPEATVFQQAAERQTPLAFASKVAVYLIVFLFPLFFLPGVTDVLEVPKQLLLIVLSLFGIIFWLGDVWRKQRISLKLHILYLPLVFLIFVWGASTLFSYSRYGSFWGWHMQVSESFLTLLFFALFFFLVHQLFAKKEEIVLLFLILFSSAALASVVGILQLWGKFFLPFDFAKTTAFNTIGSPSVFAVFAAILLPLAARLFFAFSLRWVRAIPLFAGALFLFVLLLVNNWIAWALLLVGGVLFLLVFFREKQPLEPQRVFLQMLLVAISLFFLLLRNPFPELSIAPAEVYPAYRATLQVNWKALKERPIFGTGPGTFRFNYTKFRDPQLNNTIFWTTRFGSGVSKVIDSMGTTGVVGAFSFLSLIGSLLFVVSRRWYRKESTERLLLGTVFVGAGASIAALFLFWNTMSLFFLFWFFAALAAVLSQDPKKEYRFRLFPEGEGERDIRTWISTAVSFVFVVFALGGGAVVLYLAGMRLLAEVSYQDALREFSLGNLSQAGESITQAAERNASQDVYWREKAQIDFLLLTQGMQQGSLSAEQLRNDLASVLASAEKATELEPWNVVNWLVRGFLYQSLIGGVEGAEDAALTFGYEKAKELDPVDPYVVTQLGRVHLQRAVLAARLEKQDALLQEFSKAEVYLKRALDLKRDFAPAHFQLAVLAELRGNTPEAIATLEKAKTIAPFDAGVAFQLGALYYQSQQFDKARREFERAIGINPDYSNARYLLGLIYEREGRRDAAIEQFVKIEQLNPENQEVKKILDNLRAARPALQGISQEQLPQTPVQEGKPAEIRD